MAENAKPELRRNKVLTAWVRSNGGINTVAGALGVSPQAVSHWCTGRRRMSHKAAAAIVPLYLRRREPIRMRVICGGGRRSMLQRNMAD